MIYLILAMLLYTATILFAAASARHTNITLAGAIMNTVSAIVPVAIAIPLITKKNIQGGKFGLSMAVLTGLMLAFFVLAINKSYTQNKVAIVTPVVFGGAIFLSLLPAFSFLKRKPHLCKQLVCYLSASVW